LFNKETEIRVRTLGFLGFFLPRFTAFVEDIGSRRMISEIEQSKAEQKNSGERRRKSPERERERETGEWIGMDMDGVFRKKMERSERSEGLVRVLECCLGKRERGRFFPKLHHIYKNATATY